MKRHCYSHAKSGGDSPPNFPPRGGFTGRGWFCAVLALLLCGGAARAEDAALTFPQAVERMNARNEGLLAAREEVAQREAERAAARGMRYPKAELEARQTFLNEPISLSVDPIPLSLTVQDSQFTKGQLRVSMPLYAGGRVDAANRAAEARRGEAEAQARQTGEQMITELAQRYFGVRLARRAVEVAEIKVRAMERHEYRARRLMEEGIVARVEYLNAGVALSDARTELASAERDVAIATEGLMNSLVMESAPDPVSPLFMVPDLEPLETFKSRVDGGHPVLAMLDAKLAQARQGVRAERGATLPSVYLFAAHELFPGDLTMLDPEWAAGVGAQYTLFDGAQGKNRVIAARSIERRVALLRTKYERDLKSLVVKRHEEAGRARDQFEAFGETIGLTAENLRVRTRAFEEGVATSVEVVDATLSHARAQLGRNKAAYDFDLALFQLLEASGQAEHFAEYLARGAAVAGPEPALQPSEPPAEAGAAPTESSKQ